MILIKITNSNVYCVQCISLAMRTTYSVEDLKFRNYIAQIEPLVINKINHYSDNSVFENKISFQAKAVAAATSAATKIYHKSLKILKN